MKQDINKGESIFIELIPYDKEMELEEGKYLVATETSMGSRNVFATRSPKGVSNQIITHISRIPIILPHKTPDWLIKEIEDAKNSNNGSK